MCLSADPRVLPAPPSEEIRANLGTLGIARVPKYMYPELPPFPSPETMAGRGAAAGAVEGLGVALDPHEPMAIFLLPITVPLGAAIGAIVGSAQGTSPKKMAEWSQQIRAAAGGLNEKLWQELYQAVTNKTRIAVLWATNPAIPKAEAPAVPAVTNTVVQTLLEAQVIGAGLGGPPAKGAPLSAKLVVSVRLVEARSNHIIYENTWVHLSGARKIGYWTKKRGRALEDELTRSLPQVAESIVEQLFLVYVPEK